MQRLEFPDWNTTHEQPVPSDGELRFYLDASRLFVPHELAQYSLLAAQVDDRQIWAIQLLANPLRIRLEADGEQVASRIGPDVNLDLSFDHDVVEIAGLTMGWHTEGWPTRMIWGLEVLDEHGRPVKQKPKGAGSWNGWLSPQGAIVMLEGGAVGPPTPPEEPDIDAAETHLIEAKISIDLALAALGRPVS